MLFEEDNTAFTVGKIVGFLISFSIFTTILYFVLSFTGRLSETPPVLKVLLVTFTVTLTGFLLKRFLE